MYILCNVQLIVLHVCIHVHYCIICYFNFILFSLSRLENSFMIIVVINTLGAIQLYSEERFYVYGLSYAYMEIELICKVFLDAYRFIYSCLCCISVNDTFKLNYFT